MVHRAFGHTSHSCGRIELGTTGHQVKHFFLSGRLDREGSPEVATFITRDSTSEHRQQHAAGQSEAYVVRPRPSSPRPNRPLCTPSGPEIAEAEGDPMRRRVEHVLGGGPASRIMLVRGGLGHRGPPRVRVRSARAIRQVPLSPRSVGVGAKRNPRDRPVTYLAPRRRSVDQLRGIEGVRVKASTRCSPGSTA